MQFSFESIEKQMRVGSMVLKLKFDSYSINISELNNVNYSDEI